MKTTLKILVFLLAILAAMNSDAQHIIRYEMDNHNAENCKVLFVDTLSNKVIDSFYLHERNPYWNLPYDTIETGNYSVKTYKFNNIDSLTKDEIPGLIAYGPGNISRYPGEATASHGASLSSNGQFIVTTNKLILYVFSENDFADHASKVVTYMADGKIHNTCYPEDLYVDYINITDDGNYYLLRGWAQSSKTSDGMLSIWKIINICNNQEVLTEISSNANLRGLYGLVYGNYIILMQGVINESDKYGPIVNGYLRCFDMTKNLVFFTLVDPINSDFTVLKRITSEGVHLKSKLGKNEPDQILRFDRDFTKQSLQTELQQIKNAGHNN